MNVFQAGTQGVMPIIRGNLNPASTIGYQKWEDTLSCQICNEKQNHSWKITKMLSSEHSSIKINQELLVRLEKQEEELKHLRQKVNQEQDSSKWHERIMIEKEGLRMKALQGAPNTKEGTWLESCASRASFLRPREQEGEGGSPKDRTIVPRTTPRSF